MKLKLFTLLMFAFLMQSALGQDFQKAPVNEKFDEFIKSKSQAKGIIPSPMVYHFDDIKNDKISKFSFPSSYDLRTVGLLTSVKNQGSAGHCWTFAAMAAIESRNLKFGLGAYDLSEHNLATCHDFEWEEGGNNDMAAAYFTRLSGPILETEDPYNDSEFTCSATDIDPQFYVPEVTYLPRNAEVIKYYLMNYGAISVGYYESPIYLNSLNNTYYYYNVVDNINHGVTLVGWDDDMETDGGTGAWIIKNSWGTTSRDNGYFYMSYNDTYAIYDPMIFPVRTELNNIDTLLMYDKFGAVTSYGFGDNDAYGLVKYNVSNEMYFSKIGTFINASNTYVDIEVFQTKTENTLTDTLAKVYGLFVEYPGYHTFDIPFNASGDVYIKVKYNTPGYKYPIPVETVYSGYVFPTIESNVAWISNSGESWTAIGTGTDAEVDLCIRAYASDKDIEASFIADYETICNTGSVTYTSTSNGAISNYYWDFGVDASPAVASTEGPHTVSYSSEGFKTIKLVIENASGAKDSIVNYNLVKVSNEIEVKIAPADSFSINVNDTIELRASGAASYDWSPAASIIGSSTSATVKVSPLETTYYKVEGTMNACIGTDSVKVIVSNKPINDDVCDALELSLDEEHGPFSNYLATVQENEPFPDTTGSLCNTPGYWCSEGGLQNSIWFKFTAPPSGAVSIETDGFDNQIAVYDAENCIDIISGDENLYEIIAANDDWQDTDYSATISSLSDLVPGKTYWLQMDGSAGGAEGECTILITAFKANNDSPCDAKSISILTTYSENNNYATVDTNEPMPDNTDCNAQNSWCPDDDLNATVWYKFTATASGVISIESTGFDNQIAVYAAADCADLLSGNSADYTVLGANDTYYGNDAASIYSITGLTEGTDYFIQVDGKNDNFYGSFTLYLKEWALGLNDLKPGLGDIAVYPNPSKGKFKVNLSEVINIEQYNKVEITIVSMDGTVHYKQTKSPNQNEYTIDFNQKGMYIVRVILDDRYFAVPVIIE